MNLFSKEILSPAVLQDIFNQLISAQVYVAHNTRWLDSAGFYITDSHPRGMWEATALSFLI